MIRGWPWPSNYFTCVVDGTEQPICATSHPGINILLDSAKKKQHSIKGKTNIYSAGRAIHLWLEFPKCGDGTRMGKRLLSTTHVQN